MKRLLVATFMTLSSGFAGERFTEGIEHSPVRVLIYPVRVLIYPVRVLIYPVRVLIYPVRVLIYEDLQCPDCADFRRMLDERLLPNYATRVTFEHRDFPLAKHAWARKAAIAARFFDQVEPRVGVAFRSYCFEHQPEINAANFSAKLAAFAQERKVDPEKASAALDDPALAALVEKDFQEGVARGIAHTPTLLVNGQPFVERFTYDDVSKAIDAELAAAAISPNPGAPFSRPPSHFNCSSACCASMLSGCCFSNSCRIALAFSGFFSTL